MSNIFNLISNFMNIPRAGIIIVEGPDCSGKTTLSRYLSVEFNRRGNRSVYFHCAGNKELFPAMSAFQQCVLDNAKWNKSNGSIVIIDRHWPSEYIYRPIFRPDQKEEFSVSNLSI